MKDNECYFLVFCGCMTCGKCADTFAMEGLCQTHDHPQARSKQSIKRLFYQDTCCICLDSKEHSTFLKPCGHMFCDECVVQTLDAQATYQAKLGQAVILTCPICRTSLRGTIDDELQKVEIMDTGREVVEAIWIYEFA
ncbi:hypothetical protein BKA67DRAFT_417417 [Truncatella angustata]|uniref:RING-type domain-containing protein n=1 Tax=Truncatella angustata TaxID=152316 RepID=A0A9P8RNQ4_9PEZI|nr:uncharacterized protein BKA67DRAFT_417417 [Truncatella angustata]KAH6646830.1 hypothetical protein BKA67DRAFT_417417 [Truncatella angustata]